MQERATWRIWPALILALAVQTTWLARWQPLGIHIDLPLLMVVSVALLLGWEIGLVFGLVAGALTGYCAAFNLGSFAFSRTLVGGVLGLLETRMSRDNPLAPPLCAAGAILLANFVFFLMSPTDFTFGWWVRQTLAGALLHALLIWPLHAVVARWVLPPARMMFS